MKKNFTLVIAIVAIAFTSHAQNTWTQKANFGGDPRSNAIAFSINGKGYVGTGYDYIEVKKDFWEYDPTSNSWSQKADFAGGKRLYAVGFSINDKGYVGTGSTITSLCKDFWEYDPESNTWLQRADFGGGARANAVGFGIGDKGYLGTAGGYNDFWEYDPSIDAWTQKSNFGGDTRWQATGFSVGNKGYIGVGVYNNTVFKDFWEYDPSTDTWTKKADFGGASRYNATGFSIGNKGYIGTGNSGTFPAYFSDFWEYDPLTDSWTKKADFGGTARAWAIGFGIGGKGYLGTGTNDTYPYIYNDYWEYTPDTSSCTTPTAKITPMGNLDICNTGFVKLQASSGNNYTYQWNRNNVDVPGATNQIFKAKKTGNYRVRIASGKGCNAVSKKTVVTSSCKLVEEEELNSSLNLFPNPTTGTFTLDLKLDDEENSQAIIQVLNMLGQVVYDETTSIANGALQKEIQLSDAAADGMYLVKVMINDQVFSSQINYQK